ncbi:MAG: superoxide dismutase family protein [Chloroflexota bacterium]|nr:superoxide dismutase family protein [Chloroflexota bacterium]MDE2940916.1 superoxide dismutase family protein [Chloroflexota bacterium]MDE3268383.1 superoxide dismutase family protein [Chloroflexota bacterium]
MTLRPEMVILLAPLGIVALLIAGTLVLLNIRSGQAYEPTVGLTAAAELVSPDGDPIGTVAFRQTTAGVLVMADVEGLAPGGHAFIIHEVGTCTPDFRAAGDHFNPSDSEHGFVHEGWKRGEPGGGHSGDLPNIYAASDGSARADFFAVGITLDRGAEHSIFDTNGSAIIVHEKPDAYGETESDTGDRVACGVITRS